MVVRPCRSFLSPSPTNRLSSPQFPSSTLMSHTYTTSTSSSNFQQIFNNALKAYQKRTKKDLLKHPLADRLEACVSPTSIIPVLQGQIQHLNESKHSNERVSKCM